MKGRLPFKGLRGKPTSVIFPGGSFRCMAATLTCVTAMSGFVIMGKIEQGVPSGLCRV